MVDEAARTQFQTLLAQHWGIVLKVAYSYGRTAEDRDDLAQEIALQLWRSFPRYDDNRKFSTVFGLIFWLRHPSRRRLADVLDEGTVGQSIQRAQRTLAELEQFARD